jgi:predicted component of type VI protein secretion system
MKVSYHPPSPPFSENFHISAFRRRVMQLEVQVKDVFTGQVKTLRFSTPSVRLGRNQLNDIPLDDPFVSEWHGIIRIDSPTVAYVDMGSTNGTLLGGKRLPKNVPTPLAATSTLVLGRHEIVVTPAAVPAPNPAAAEPGVRFGKTIGLGQPLPTLGPPTGVPVRVREASTSEAGEHAPSGEHAPAPAGDARRADEILGAFCEAFVGLRKGFEQFGAEVGVRTVSGSTPLHRGRTAEEIRSYLMDPSVDPAISTRELIGVFADFGIHHVAMMGGITEGVRALLQSLDPRAFELGGGGFFSGSKTRAQWQAYLEQFDQLAGDDEQLHSAIFGDEFARAYAGVSTSGAPASGDDTKDDE